MKKFLKNILPWIIVVISICLLGLILYKIKNNTISDFDNNIYNIIIKNKSDLLTKIFKYITYLGESKLIILAFIILLFTVKNKLFSISFGLLTIGSFGVNFFVKHIVKRPRPVDIALIEEDGYSFLSTHSIAAVVVYGFLIYNIWISKMDKIYKILLTILLSLIIVIIPISRVYLGVHFASDVIAGMLFGLAFLIAFIKIIYEKRISK